MKQILIIFVVLLSVISSLFAQKEVAVLDYKFKQPFLSSKAQSININNKETGEFWTLIRHKKELIVYHFNDEFEVKKKINIKWNFKNYKEIMGYGFDKGSLVLFSYFSNLEGRALQPVSTIKKIQLSNKVASLKIDRKSYEITEDDIKFKLKSEISIGVLQEEDKYYVITSDVDDVINIYEFVNSLNFKKYSFNISEIRGRKSNKPKKDIGNVIVGKDFNLGKVKIVLQNRNFLQKTHYGFPNSIKAASRNIKLYVKDDVFSFLLDNNPDVTSIINFDKKNEKGSVIEIDKFKFSKKTKKHNSTILGEKIVQYVSDGDEINIRIKSLVTGKKGI